MLLARIVPAHAAAAVIARTFVFAAACALGTATLSRADDTAVARVGQPATVSLVPSRQENKPPCIECDVRSGTILKVKLRPLDGGAGLIVRIFLDKPDANTASSIDDPAFAGSLALSATDGSQVQEFSLPLPAAPRSYRQVTIILVAIGRAQPATGSVSVEGAELARQNRTGG